MSVLGSSSMVSAQIPQIQILSGSPTKPAHQSLLVNNTPSRLCLRSIRSRGVKRSSANRRLSVQASSDGGRSPNASSFVGGFVLGGIIVGTLGCVFAPQISKEISKALWPISSADKKELMRKLPKFIYDEEKALEKTRKILEEKIAKLNSAIDDVSGQLRTEDGSNGAALSPDEVEASSI